MLKLVLRKFRCILINTNPFQFLPKYHKPQIKILRNPNSTKNTVNNAEKKMHPFL